MRLKICLLLTGMLLLTACAGRLHTDAPMERFSFSHAGMSTGSIYTLTAERAGDGLIAHFDLFCSQEFSLPMTQQDADALRGILDSHGLWNLNGFHRADRTVSDGRSFRLNVRFADGQELSASGGNVFPDDYGAAVQAIKAVFIQIMENNGISNPF